MNVAGGAIGPDGVSVIDAERILLVDDARLRALGTDEQLLATDELYQALVPRVEDRFHRRGRRAKGRGGSTCRRSRGRGPRNAGCRCQDDGASRRPRPSRVTGTHGLGHWARHGPRWASDQRARSWRARIEA